MRLISSTLAAAVFASAMTTAAAQDKEWFTESRAAEGMYDIRFPGGTAAEYFNELGLELEGRLNVIVQDGVDLVSLPKINVRNVTGLDVIELPQKLSDGLYTDGSSNLVAAFGGPVEEVGAFTVVVKVDPALLHRLESKFVQMAGERRFDLRFGGGTAVEYVEAIRKAYPGANILAMPGLEGFKVPAVNLDGVTVDAALESIEGQEAMVDGAWAKVRLSDADIEGREERVFTISLERRESAQQTRVWSVAKILNAGVAEQDLLSSVQVALNLNEQNAVVRFHPETKIIMVRGMPEAVDTVNGTLGQIGQSAAHDQMADSHQQDQELIARLRDRIAALEQRLTDQTDR